MSFVQLIVYEHTGGNVTASSSANRATRAKACEELALAESSTGGLQLASVSRRAKKRAASENIDLNTVFDLRRWQSSSSSAGAARPAYGEEVVLLAVGTAARNALSVDTSSARQGATTTRSVSLVPEVTLVEDGPASSRRHGIWRFERAKQQPEQVHQPQGGNDEAGERSLIGRGDQVKLCFDSPAYGTVELAVRGAIKSNHGAGDAVFASAASFTAMDAPTSSSTRFEVAPSGTTFRVRLLDTAAVLTAIAARYSAAIEDRISWQAAMAKAMDMRSIARATIGRATSGKLEDNAALESIVPVSITLRRGAWRLAVHRHSRRVAVVPANSFVAPLSVTFGFEVIDDGALSKRDSALGDCDGTYRLRSLMLSDGGAGRPLYVALDAASNELTVTESRSAAALLTLRPAAVDPTQQHVEAGNRRLLEVAPSPAPEDDGTSSVPLVLATTPLESFVASVEPLHADALHDAVEVVPLTDPDAMAAVALHDAAGHALCDSADRAARAAACDWLLPQVGLSALSASLANARHHVAFAWSLVECGLLAEALDDSKAKTTRQFLLPVAVRAAASVVRDLPDLLGTVMCSLPHQCTGLFDGGVPRLITAARGAAAADDDSDSDLNRDADRLQAAWDSWKQRGLNSAEAAGPSHDDVNLRLATLGRTVRNKDSALACPTEVVDALATVQQFAAAQMKSATDASAVVLHVADGTGGITVRLPTADAPANVDPAAAHGVLQVLGGVSSNALLHAGADDDDARQRVAAVAEATFAKDPAVAGAAGTEPRVLRWLALVNDTTEITLPLAQFVVAAGASREAIDVVLDLALSSHCHVLRRRAAQAIAQLAIGLTDGDASLSTQPFATASDVDHAGLLGQCLAADVVSETRTVPAAVCGRLVRAMTAPRRVRHACFWPREAKGEEVEVESDVAFILQCALVACLNRLASSAANLAAGAVASVRAALDASGALQSLLKSPTPWHRTAPLLALIADTLRHAGGSSRDQQFPSSAESTASGPGDWQVLAEVTDGFAQRLAAAPRDSRLSESCKRLRTEACSVVSRVAHCLPKLVKAAALEVRRRASSRVSRWDLTLESSSTSGWSGGLRAALRSVQRTLHQHSRRLDSDENPACGEDRHNDEGDVASNPWDEVSSAEPLEAITVPDEEAVQAFAVRINAGYNRLQVDSAFVMTDHTNACADERVTVPLQESHDAPNAVKGAGLLLTVLAQRRGLVAHAHLIEPMIVGLARGLVAEASSGGREGDAVCAALVESQTMMRALTLLMTVSRLAARGWRLPYAATAIFDVLLAALGPSGYRPAQQLIYDQFRSRPERQRLTSLLAPLLASSVGDVELTEVFPAAATASTMTADDEVDQRLLRFLQLTCEGHFQPMQEYLCSQPGGLHSVCVPEFLVDYIRHRCGGGGGGVSVVTTGASAAVLLQAVATLAELLQGPCRGNQERAVHHGAAEVLFRVLCLAEQSSSAARLMKSDSDEAHSNSNTAVVQLPAMCVTALHAMLEGHTDVALHARIAEAATATAAVRGSLHHLLQRSSTQLVEGGASDALDDPAHRPAAAVYGFLRVVLDCITAASSSALAVHGGDDSDASSSSDGDDGNDEDGDAQEERLRIAAAADALDELLASHRETLGARMASVDIAWGPRGVQRRYFPMARIDAALDREREAMLDSATAVTAVEGGSDERRLGQFLRDAREYNALVKVYGRAVLALPAVSVVAVLSEWFPLILAVAINVLLLATATPRPPPNEVRTYDTDDGDLATPTAAGRAVFVLTIIQLVLHAGMSGVGGGALVVRAGAAFKTALQLEQQAAEARAAAAGSRQHHAWLSDSRLRMRCAFYALHRIAGRAFARAFFVGMAAGAVAAPLCHSFMLLYVVELAPALQRLLLAIARSWRSLVWSALFMLLLIYCFAAIAFYSGYNKYFTADSTGAGGNCEHLPHCIFVLVVHGLPTTGGITEKFVKPDFNHDGDDAAAYGRMVYDFLFFVVFNVLMLNVVFGVILDTFSALRQQREAVLQFLSTRCFVCGLEAADFDDFEAHRREEHQPWAYAAYIEHVAGIDVDERDGLESYVAECVGRSDPRLFPYPAATRRGRA